MDEELGQVISLIIETLQLYVCPAAKRQCAALPVDLFDGMILSWKDGTTVRGIYRLYCHAAFSRSSACVDLVNINFSFRVSA